MTRTRLAPSPTGYLHVGTLRTALYCYLLTKKNKGSFFLRIEDTDQSRSVEGAVPNLLKYLHWAGLDPDEGVCLDEQGNVTEKGEFGPYTQSSRLDIYKKHADQLIENGQAYHCFCTPGRLTEMRKEQQKRKVAPMYDRKCLHLNPEEIESKKKEGIPFVVRQKIPRERILKIHDLIRGKVTFDCSTIDDQILMKSDGFPTYHLAHVVDDHLMKTNPVIRGEEWLPSLPKHILLFEALGWEAPPFAHLPLLLNKDRSKLSKRQGDVSVEDYAKKGYLPEAMVNFVALLGWNPGTEQEKFTMDELIEAFSIEKINKAGAVFDIEKLQWFNSWYIRKKSVSELTGLVVPYLKDAGIKTDEFDKEYIEKAVSELQDRFKYLAEAPDLMKFFFEEPVYDKELLLNEKMKVTEEIARKGLNKTVELLTSLDDFSKNSLKDNLIKMIRDMGLKNGQVLWPMRAALTGAKFSPGAFEVAAVLGKEKTVERLEKGKEKLAQRL